MDEYIAGQAPGVQSLLQAVRAAIRKGAPKAEEVISYNIPAYRLNGEVAIYFAVWKNHYSLYPAKATLVSAFRDELAAYEVNKGTIRFPLTEDVPVKLIASIAKFRAAELANSRRRR